MDSRLRDGTRLAKVMPPEIGKGKISAAVKSETKLVSAEMHYSTMGLPGNQKKRDYKTVPAKLIENRIVADLPPDNAALWFLTVTVRPPYDERRRQR